MTASSADPRTAIVAAVKPLVPKAKVVKGTSYDRLQLEGKTLAYLNAPRKKKPGARIHVVIPRDDLPTELKKLAASVHGRSEFNVVDDPAPVAYAIKLAADSRIAAKIGREQRAATKPEPKPKKAAAGDAPEPVEALPRTVEDASQLDAILAAANPPEKVVEVTPDPKPAPKKTGRGKGAKKPATKGTKRVNKAQALVDSGLATDLKDARAQLADMGEGS